MIRSRYPVASLLVFVGLACAVPGVDKQKQPTTSKSGRNLHAQREMKEKLRHAISLPKISVVMGYRVNYRGEFENMGWIAEISATSQIPEIEKESKGDATDAKRYSRLARLYYRANESAKSKEACLKAVALFREQLEKHSDDTAIQLGLADSLDYADKSEEAEALVRRVLKDHPSEWHAWTALGRILDGKSWVAILGHTSWHFSGAESLLQLVRTAQPTPESIAAAQQYRREAEACFDRAVRLAPGEAEVYRRRGGSRYRYGMLHFALKFVQGGEDRFLRVFLGTGGWARDPTGFTSSIGPGSPGVQRHRLCCFSRSG